DVWKNARPYVDPAVYADVALRLDTQLRDAKWWRDACLQYFRQYSRMPIPDNVESPSHTIDELMKIKLNISNYESPSPELLNRVR
ncbi:MAG: alpha-glucuronidase, partial [Duncaniella sp.]|nr:alpha-glucuronidase [Duncaniella sp.]